MNANDVMREFALNNAWSNERLHTVVAELNDTAYRAARASFFPSIHLTLSHILYVDLYYLDALARGTRGVEIWAELAGFERSGTFSELRAKQRETDQRLIELAALDLDDEIRMQRGDHVQTETRANVLMHMFQHQIHHRGQVHAMLSSTPIKPPQLDEYFID